MTIEQGIIQALIASSGLLFYASFKLDDRHSVFGLLLFLAGLMNISLSIFSGVVIADVKGLSDAWISVVSYAALGYFMLFFVALLYFGVVVYMNDAFTMANGGDGKQFGWENNEDDL